MAYEKKEGDISVFLNPKKTAENNHPNYTGTALVNGETMDVSLWLKKPEGKSVFLAGSIKKHIPRDTPSMDEDPIQSAPVPPSTPAPTVTQQDDDLPF